jgi:hypothetical protein
MFVRVPWNFSRRNRDGWENCERKSKKEVKRMRRNGCWSFENLKKTRGFRFRWNFLVWIEGFLDFSKFEKSLITYTMKREVFTVFFVSSSRTH